MTIQQHASFDSSAAELNATSKLVKAWESKNAKNAAKAGGVSLMALSLAACGGSSTPVADAPVVDAPVVDTPVVDDTPVVPAVNTITKALLDFKSGDTLAGTSGSDVLNVEINADLGATTTISGIETVNVTSYGATTVNFTKITDVTKFVTSDSTGAVTLASVADATMALGFAGTGTNSITAGYKAGTLDGAADVVNVDLSGASAVTLVVDAGFEDISINTGTGTGDASAMAKSDIDTLTVPGVTKMTITGEGPLDLANAAVSGVTSINASTMTGALTTGTANATTGFVDGAITGAATNATILLGSGSDNIGFTSAAATKSDSVKLGAGNDMLVLNAAGAGPVVVMGEAGDDHIRVVTTALEVTDVINGGDGTDTVTLAVGGANELLLRGVETVKMTTAATGTQTFTADKALAVTASVNGSAVDVVSLSAGSTVTTALSAAGSSAATNVTVDYAAVETSTTVALGGGTSGDITITDVAALTITADDAIDSDSKTLKFDDTDTTSVTMTLEEVTNSTNNALAIEDMSAVTSLSITASKAAVFGLIGGTSGMEAMKTMSVAGEKAVTLGAVGKNSTATAMETLTVTGKANVTVGELHDVSKLASYTVTSNPGTGAVGDVVVEAIDESALLASVALTANKGSVTVNEIGATGVGTAASTFTVSAYDEINLDEPVFWNNAAGSSVSLTSTNKGGIFDGSAGNNVVVKNELGDLSVTLSTGGKAEGTFTTSTNKGAVTLNATAVTGGSVLTVENGSSAAVTTDTSTVTLGAAKTGTTNALTVDGITDVLNVTGGTGTDTVVFAGTDDHLTSGTINLGGGTADSINFANIVATLSATSEGVVINNSNAAVTFDSGQTYTTSIAAKSVAEYSDAGGTAKDVSTTDFSLVISGVETFVGTANADHYTAANTGGSFNGGNGADIVTLGSGVDTLVYNASSNGLDVVSGFSQAGKDLIDVTAYLTTFVAANVDAVPLVTSDDTIENDHIFVVNFDGDIAAKALEGTDFGDLFSSDDGYLLTTKGVMDAVVVVQGDDQTEVFYVTNDNIAAIDKDDVTLIATLSDVTNSTLLTSDNFVVA
ncbi:hypothetical protein N9X08_04870 [Planktomarina temperata]|nr:hypothetical protein [Planktomarina temperata]